MLRRLNVPSDVISLLMSLWRSCDRGWSLGTKSLPITHLFNQKLATMLSRAFFDVGEELMSSNSASTTEKSL